MLIVKTRLQRLVLQCTDAIIAVASLVAAYYIRTHLLRDIYPNNIPFLGSYYDYLLFLPVAAVATPIILFRLNFYHLGLSQRFAHVLNIALQSALALFLGFVLVQFFFKIQLSRFIFVIFIPIFTLLILLRHSIHQTLRKHTATRFQLWRYLMVVSDRPITPWPALLDEHPEFGFRLARSFLIQDFSLSNFIDALHEHSISLVIFDLRQGNLANVTETIQACEDEGIEVWFCADFIETRIARASVNHFENRPLLVFRSTPDSSWELIGKILLDRIGAGSLFLLASPLFLACALLIKFTSPGPVFFRQPRSGHYGRPFTMFKFRSMVTDAEQRKTELMQFNEMSGPVFKVTNDPRVTPIGRWLRKTSLDELPQLINVLRGEMSLVGPRPLPLNETLAMSERTQRRRLSVKPGITCLWQISGRNNVCNFTDWVRLDLDYIDRWSLWLDLRILFFTIPVVLFGKGAK